MCGAQGTGKAVPCKFMSSEKTERQLHLLMHLLASRESVSWENIRTEVRGFQDGSGDAVQRRFERDKDELRGMGFEIETCFHHYYGKEAGYRIKPSSQFFDLKTLSEDEKNILFSLSSLFSKPGTFPFAQELAFSLAKLKSMTRRGQDEGGEEARAPRAERVFMIPKSVQKNSAKVSGYLKRIYEAIQSQKKVMFRYRRPEGAKSEKRILHPYVVYCRQGVWYVAGYSEERKAERIFRLSRMSVLKVNKKRKSVPDYEIPEDFNLRRLLFKETYNVGKGEPVPVRLTFSREFGWLAERQFSSGAEVREGKNGSRVLSLDVKNIKAFARKLLPFGGHVTVLGPENLKRAMKDELLKLKKMHV